MDLIDSGIAPTPNGTMPGFIPPARIEVWPWTLGSSLDMLLQGRSLMLIHDKTIYTMGNRSRCSTMLLFLFYVLDGQNNHKTIYSIPVSHFKAGRFQLGWQAY